MGERAVQRRREQDAVATAIFGSTSKTEIFEQVSAFCGAHLDSGVSDFLFFEIGRYATVFGAELGDGRRVVVKAHTNRVPRERQDAVNRIQTLLHQRRFPCPKPLLPPQVLGGGHARVEELVDAGEQRDPHEPRVRRAMAELLAQQVEIAGSESPGGLADTQSTIERQSLWGGGPKGRHQSPSWIAGFARPAKRLAASAGTKLVAHGDWTGKNLRFSGGGVEIVYDWDGLQYDTEERLVGRVSAKFTALPHTPNPPTPEAAREFVNDYERARGKRFAHEERQRLAAARTYSIAYKAHVEYGKKSGKRGAWQQALKDFGRDYLEP